MLLISLLGKRRKWRDVERSSFYVHQPHSNPHSCHSRRLKITPILKKRKEKKAVIFENLDAMKRKQTRQDLPQPM